MQRLYLGMAVAAAALCVSVADAQIFDLSKYPDWAGQWRRVPDGGPPRYDPSKKNGLAQEAPLKPEYQKLLEASLKDQEAGGQGLDMTYKCIPTGMPRMMAGVFPVEWVFTPSTTFMLSEFMIQAPRRIYTDGRDFPKDEEPTYVGYSIGKWLDTDGDGHFDTLEVETRNIKTPRTYDQAGIPFAEDGEAIVKERIFLDKANPDILHDEITTTDSALTRPWTRHEELSSRPQGAVDGEQLHRGQHARGHRRGELFSQRRRLPDACPQRPAAAGFALFPRRAEAHAELMLSWVLWR